MTQSEIAIFIANDFFEAEAEIEEMEELLDDSCEGYDLQREIELFR